MAVSDAFVESVLKKLRPLGMVFARRMFGGVGLYAGEQFFGILYKDRLYFKVTTANIAEYQKVKMNPFKPFKDKPLTLKYYEVPANVQRNSLLLRKWAAKAIMETEAKLPAPENKNKRKNSQMRGKWYE